MIRRALVIGMVALAFIAGAHSHKAPQAAIIGSSQVPSITCNEDEQIGYVVTNTPPYNLGCVPAP